MIELDDSNLAATLKGDKPVLVDFHATWCGPCKRLAPSLEKLAEKHKAILTTVKVDIDKAPEATVDNNIEVVPTLVLFKGGKEVARRNSGTEAAIEAWIVENVAKS